MPAAVAVEANATIQVPVSLQSAGNAIGAVGFTLKLDPNVVFDATDADGDGLADAVQFNVGQNLLRWAVYDEGKHELQIAIAGVMLPMTPFADGTLLTVTLKTLVAGDASATFDNASAGSVEGYGIPVLTEAESAAGSQFQMFLPSVLK